MSEPMHETPSSTPLSLPSGLRRHGDAEDRARRILAQRLAILTISTGLVYLSWVTAVLDWSHHPVVASAFVFAETCALLLFAMAAAGSWRLRFKPAQAILQPLPEPVDVLITVCGEPLDVVTRTIEAASRITWIGPLRVHVLDDGGSVDVEEAARRCGVAYRSRRREQLPVTDGKAGNLNFGLQVTSGAYVLTLDADHVPSATIVERLAPYLTLPKVAFVQSKQSFIAPAQDPFSSVDPVFYDTMQKAFDANDTVLSCGSGVLYRRAALQTVGGFITWNVVEDLTTSYELHSRGWKSLYYPYPLTTSQAPDTIGAVYRQRGRWAFDTLRLVLWKNPLMRQALSWPKRLNYFVIGFSYLTAGFIAPLLFLLPVWSYATGDALVTGRHELQFAIARAVYFAMMAAALRWMFRGHRPGRQFQMLVGLFPVYMVSTLRALLYPNRKPRTGTADAARTSSTLPGVIALLPQLLLLAANVAGPFYALVNHNATVSFIAVNVPASALAIWSLSQVCLAAFDRNKWNADRHPVRFYVSAVRQ
jgi:cellulose synthase (UDP-forming)